MKQSSLAAVLATVLGLGGNSHLSAQQAGGGGAIPAKSVKATKSAKLSSTRIELVEIRSGPLKHAVDHLKDQLAQNSLPPMNVILGSGTSDLVVPDLLLRNVAGADALRLLCTSAQCEMDPIFSESNTLEGRVSEYVIGYQIYSPVPRSKASYSRGMMGFFGGMGGAAPARAKTAPVYPVAASSVGQKPKTKEAVGAMDAGGPATVAKPKPGGRGFSSRQPAQLNFGAEGGYEDSMGSSAKKKRGSEGFGFGGGGAGMDFGGGAEDDGGGMFDSGMSGFQRAPTTQIYALGRVTTDVKFEEVEKTLISILAAAGLKPEQAKISLHETTNVLVVKGSAEAHSMVAQLLQSLEKNQKDNEVSEAAKAKRRESEILSEMNLMKHRYERQVEDLLKARSEAEAESREMQKRLRDLQDELRSKK